MRANHNGGTAHISVQRMNALCSSAPKRQSCTFGISPERPCFGVLMCKTTGKWTGRACASGIPWNAHGFACVKDTQHSWHRANTSGVSRMESAQTPLYRQAHSAQVCSQYQHAMDLGISMECPHTLDCGVAKNPGNAGACQACASGIPWKTHSFTCTNNTKH